MSAPNKCHTNSKVGGRGDGSEWGSGGRKASGSKSAHGSQVEWRAQTPEVPARSVQAPSSAGSNPFGPGDCPRSSHGNRRWEEGLVNKVLSIPLAPGWALDPSHTGQIPPPNPVPAPGAGGKGAGDAHFQTPPKACHALWLPRLAAALTVLRNPCLPSDLIPYHFPLHSPCS